MALNEINISKNFENYSQRNNELLPHVACGPTNMIQALEYAGWEWNNKQFPELKQPEDKLLKFTRTNENVLKYYEKKYKNMYRNWIEEAKSLQKEGQELWEVNCKKAYPPNEIHDVMNFATNAFLGYSEEDIKNNYFNKYFFHDSSASYKLSPKGENRNKAWVVLLTLFAIRKTANMQILRKPSK